MTRPDKNTTIPTERQDNEKHNITKQTSVLVDNLTPFPLAGISSVQHSSNLRVRVRLEIELRIRARVRLGFTVSDAPTSFSI
jgi:hypothetical protein